MHIIDTETASPPDAGSDVKFSFSSHSITAFARALSLEESIEGREALAQPILVVLSEHPHWLPSVEALSRSSGRMVIAIDESWLEDHYQDDHGYAVPVATSYQVVEDQLLSTGVMLHHSRKGVARLCKADLSEAYVILGDGSGFWEPLDQNFVKDAAVGIERAEEWWFWHHDELTTKELVAAIHETEAEERLERYAQLPGVTLSLGRE